MKKIILTLILILYSGTLQAEESVNIPLDEFKSLYKEKLTREIKKDLEDEIISKEKKKEFIYSIQNADYTMRISKKGCSGSLSIKGRWISGSPEKIKLLSKDLIIESIPSITGGSLLTYEEKSKNISFLPDEQKEFSIALNFFIPLSQDNRSDFISMDIPHALRNSIKCIPSKNIRISEVPGAKNGDTWNFSPRSRIIIRFADKKTAMKKSKTTDNLSGKYKAIKTPETILEKVSFFTTYEENGNALSTLVMNIPGEVGSHIKLDAVPGYKIWSLKVNNKKMKVYTDKDNLKWIIPVSREKDSGVELTLIKEGRKIGLHGKLQTEIPGIDFPAKELFLSISLPDRVELTSFEGPISPFTLKKKSPSGFKGKSYYFKKSFYKGRGMKISLAYKEPAK